MKKIKIYNYKYIKKSIALILGAVCLIGATGCENNSSSNGGDKEKPTQIVFISEKGNEDRKNEIDISNAKLVEEGKLTVAMVADYPPFEYYTSNGSEPIGVDVDIANAISKKLNLKIQIKDVPWDDDLFSNIGKEYDIVCSAITITDERKKEVIFSDSYIDSYQSVVVSKENDITFDSFDDLNGLRVAVQKDTVSDKLIKNLTKKKKLKVKLSENDVATECFNQLIDGKIDAIVCDSSVAEGQVERNSDKLKEAYRDESNIEQFAIAIGKDNEELLKGINEALEQLSDEGYTKKIISSWFGR